MDTNCVYSNYQKRGKTMTATNEAIQFEVWHVGRDIPDTIQGKDCRRPNYAKPGVAERVELNCLRDEIEAHGSYAYSIVGLDRAINRIWWLL